MLDLETTGATPASCEITEIGAVKYLGGELLGTFHTLVNPDMPIPPMITVLTGITQMMVVEAPRIGEALPSFLEFIGESVVVGHNVRFDMSFLRAACDRLGYDRPSNHTVDTLALARRLVRKEVRTLGLGALAAHFGSPVKPNHRALDDARATAHVLWGLLERAGTLGVTHLEDLLRLPTARGAADYRKIALADGLPRRPGVYLFRDGRGEILYVGKAKNLRTRVRSYFYGDGRRRIADLLRELAAVDHRECATEIEAEITELRLIHAHRPRYNRRSKPAKASHWVKLTEERYPRLSIVRTCRSDGLYLGPFRSRRQASLVVTAVWDAVPIRRCGSKGRKRTPACGFSQLGVALCPCDGSISEQEYAGVVDLVRAGITTDPEILLAPLVEKIRAHARGRRFEEAASVRDRHRALAAALERRRAWEALQGAGTLWAVDAKGDHVVVQSGRLAGSWSDPAAPPLLVSAPGPDEPWSQVPRTVALAEEAALVWRWLDRPGVEIVDSRRPFAMPARRVRHLESLAV